MLAFMFFQEDQQRAAPLGAGGSGPEVPTGSTWAGPQRSGEAASQLGGRTGEMPGVSKRKLQFIA